MANIGSRERRTNWWQMKIREAKKKKKVLPKEKTIAEFCISMSASERVAKEILKTFCDFGTIRIVQDQIIIKK